MSLQIGWQTDTTKSFKTPSASLKTNKFIQINMTMQINPPDDDKLSD